MKKFNSLTGQWEDDGKPVAKEPAAKPAAKTATKPAAKTSSTKPAPAKKKDDPWSGGFFSDLKAAAGAVGSGVQRAGEDVATVVRSLPQFPKQVYENVAAQMPGDTQYEVEQLKRIEAKADELGLEGQRREAYIAFARPGLHQFLPGSYIAEKLIGGEAKDLGEHPGIAVLDVLPYVGKLGRAVSKGSKFAGRAAEAAKASGKPHIAADIAEKGPRLHQIVGQAVREVESKLPGQKVAGIRPRLEELGVTRRGRTVQDLVGQAQRKVSGSSQRFLEQVEDAQKRLEITPERSKELTTMAREAADPEWHSRLPDNERQYLSFFDEVNRRARDEDIGRKQAFEWGPSKDFYSKAEAPNLWRVNRRLNFISRLADQAEAKLAAATPDTPPAKLAQWERQVRTHRRRAEVITEEGNKIAAKTPPAQWHDTLRSRSLAQAQDAIRATNPPEAWDAMLKDLESGAFHRLGNFSDKDWAALVDSQWKNWQRLRDEGLEPPQFVSRAPVDAARRLERPYFIPKGIRSPATTKARAKYDYRPYTDDMAVAARYDHLERTQRIAAEDFVAKVREKGWVKDQRQVMDEIDSLVGHLAKNGKELKELRDTTASKFYTRYTPESIFSGQAAKTLKEGDYLPTGIYRLLEDMAKPPRRNVLAAPLQAGSAVLRTSVLRLNPFYYFGNLVSGVPLLLAKGNPLDLRFLKQARRMMKEGTIPEWVPTGPRKIIGDVEQAYQFRAGASVGQMLNDSWGPINTVKKAAMFSDKVVNSLDDMYRTTAALAEYNRAVKKGRKADVAEAQAIDHASKVMNNLDRLTPTERYVVKSIFPFYSWSAHLLRYVMSYPFDHPWRAAFVTKMARQTLEEWDAEVPQRMMRYIALGSQDKEGWQWFLGANDILPWVSISEMGTLSGLMSRLNPIYKSGMQYAGLDPFTGGPERFPSYTKDIDPVTGKPSYVREPLAELVAENLMPQSEFLTQEDWQREYQAEKPGGGTLEEILRNVFGANVFQRKMEPATPASRSQATTGQPATAAKKRTYNSLTGTWE